MKHMKHILNFTKNIDKIKDSTLKTNQYNYNDTQAL